jgi:DNA gyrase inhibitor GyrI
VNLNQFETGVIPGGWYARRRVRDWEKVVQEGNLPKLFENLAKDNAEGLYTILPSIEFYRSREELLLLVPVQEPPESKEN